MNLDTNSFIPTATNWFSPSVEYEGEGRAEFSNPKGSIEGHTTARFDEFGGCVIELKIESFQCERQLHFGIMEFLSGQTPAQVGKSVTMGGGGMDNPCTRIVISSPLGTFTGTGTILYGLRGYQPFRNDGTLQLHTLRSQYDANSAGAPKYWVFPLFNLVCQPILRHATLDQHPLRIYPTPRIPNGLPNNEVAIATLRANEKNTLIIFEYGGELAFIEGLPDFEERKAKLSEGKERTLITAVMVGSLGSDTVDSADLKDWPAVDLLSVLGFATGVETGAPWIELRDSTGALVRRIHVAVGRPTYAWGRGALKEEIHRTTGYLLNKYLSSPERGQPHLLVPLKLSVSAGLIGPTLEENFIPLFRAFETICNAYGFKTQNLLGDIDPSYAAKVKNVLKRAADDIRTIADTARRSDQVQAARIDQIAKRTQETPGGVDRAFNVAIVDLLNHFGLPDADIAERHYAAYPVAYQKKWAQMLSIYRAECLHKGYFELLGENDLKKAYAVLRHLHDILARLILKMLGYDKFYQPSTIVLTASEPVDWVQPSTSPSLLGYRL